MPAGYYSNVKWPQLIQHAKRTIVITGVQWAGSSGRHALLPDRVNRTRMRTSKGAFLEQWRDRSVCVCDPYYGAGRIAIPAHNRPGVHRPETGVRGFFLDEALVIP